MKKRLALPLLILSVLLFLFGCKKDPKFPPSVQQARTYIDTVFQRIMENDFEYNLNDSVTLQRYLDTLVLYGYDQDIDFASGLYLQSSYTPNDFNFYTRLALLDSAQAILTADLNAPFQDTLLPLIYNMKAIFYKYLYQPDLVIGYSDLAVQGYQAIDLEDGVIPELINQLVAYGEFYDVENGKRVIGEFQEIEKKNPDLPPTYLVAFLNGRLILEVHEAYLLKLEGKPEEADRIFEQLLDDFYRHSAAIKQVVPRGQSTIYYNLFQAFMTRDHPGDQDSALYYLQLAQSVLGEGTPSDAAFYGNVIARNLTVGLLLNQEYAAVEQKLKNNLKALNFPVDKKVLSSTDLKNVGPADLDLLVSWLDIYSDLRWKQYEATGQERQLLESIEWTKKAMSVLDYIRNLRPVISNQVVQRERHQQVFIQAVDRALERALKFPAPGNLEDAFTLAQQSKFYVLRQLVNKRLTPDNLTQAQQELTRTEQALQTEIEKTQLLLKNSRPAQLPVLQAQLVEKTEALDQFYRSLRQGPNQALFSYFLNRSNPQVPSVRELQENWLDEQSAILKYHLLGYQPGYFFITKNSFEFFPIKRTPAFFRALESVEQAGKEAVSMTKYSADAYLVYRTLMQQALESAQAQKINRLLIVPDNMLFSIPFDALLTAPADPENGLAPLPFLVKKYTTEFHYSLAATDLFNRIYGQDAFAPTIAAFIADYQTSDTRSQEPLRCVEDPLPAMTETFQNKTAQLFPELQVFYPAREREFYEFGPQANILHFIMHGCTESVDPLNYNLAFTNEANARETEQINGELTVQEIQQTPLNARIVVIGSCSASKGKQRQGEGLVSIAQAFNMAGCLNLITTLNPVLDEPTAYLHAQFYENLRRGQDSALAMANAKRSYLAVKNHESNPIYWANLISVGAPQTTR